MNCPKKCPVAFQWPVLRKKRMNKKLIQNNILLGYVFLRKTPSRLNNYLLGPNNSDSSSKTTYIVLFPGLNSPIQVKIPQI